MLESLGHSELSVRHRVATGQEMFSGKILQGQGKAREFYFESGKIYSLKKKSEKIDYR